MPAIADKAFGKARELAAGVTFAIAVALAGDGAIPLNRSVIPFAVRVSKAMADAGLPAPVKGLAKKIHACLQGKAEMVDAVFDVIERKTRRRVDGALARAQLEEILRPHMSEISEVWQVAQCVWLGLEIEGELDIELHTCVYTHVTLISIRALLAAIRVLYCALPKGTRQYVVTSAGDPLSTHTVEATGLLASAAVTPVPSVSHMGVTPSTSTPAPGTTLIDLSHDLAVVAFVSVSCRDGASEAAYIRDLAQLMNAFDAALTMANGTLEKIKGTQESIILKYPYSGETQAQAACRYVVCSCLHAQFSVRGLRGFGIPLDTIAGVRVGVCCGPVTGGVLGSKELMYDVFGDTVNTAARLMQNAGVWDCLVTETVAQGAITEGEYKHPAFAPHSLELVQSDPFSVALKGKGDFPVRRMCLNRHSLQMVETHSTSYLMEFVGDGSLTQRWADKLLDSSMDLGSVTGSTPLEISLHPSDTPKIPDPAETIPQEGSCESVAAILKQPWDVIRASFQASSAVPRSRSDLRSLAVAFSRQCSRAGTREHSEGHGGIHILSRTASTPYSLHDVSAMLEGSGGTPRASYMADDFSFSGTDLTDMGDIDEGTDNMSETDSYVTEKECACTASEGVSDAGVASTPDPSCPTSIMPSGTRLTIDTTPEDASTETSDSAGRDWTDKASSSSLSVIDRGLVDALETLFHCVPEGSPLYQLSDRLREATCGNTVSNIPGVAPIEGERERGSSPTRRAKRRRIRRHERLVSRLTVLTKWETLVLVMRAMPQALRLSLNHQYRTNSFVIMDAMQKVKAQFLTLIVVMVLQLGVCGYAAHDVWSNLTRYATDDLIDAISPVIPALRAAVACQMGICAIRLVLLVFTHLIGSRLYVSVIHRSIAPDSSHRNTEYRSRYRSLERVSIWMQYVCAVAVATTVWIGSALYRSGGDLMEGSMTLQTLWANNWMSMYLFLCECFISLFSLSPVNSVPTLFWCILLFLPSSMAIGNISPEVGILFSVCVLLCLFGVLQAVMQITSFVLGTRFVTETVAARVLVSRVASGRYFNRLLTPQMAQVTAWLRPPMSPKRTQAIVQFMRQSEWGPELENSVILSMFYNMTTQDAEADREAAAESEGVSPGCVSGPTCEAGTHEFIAGLYSKLGSGSAEEEGEGEGEGEGDGVSTPFSDRCDTAALEAGTALACAPLVPLATPQELSILQESGTEFFPLMVYAKLDIVGFTKYCSVNGSDIVGLLNVLFMAWDGIVDQYAADGVTKVKTIGDAYEVVRPFTARELSHTTVDSLSKGVAALVQAVHAMVACSIEVFDSADAGLSVRAGVGLGPGFAAVLGGYRVCYEIFGQAPTRARVLEGLAPVGKVAVGTHAHALLAGNGRFTWDGTVECPVSSPCLPETSDTESPSTAPVSEYAAWASEYQSVLAETVSLSCTPVPPTPPAPQTRERGGMCDTGSACGAPLCGERASMHAVRHSVPAVPTPVYSPSPSTPLHTHVSEATAKSMGMVQGVVLKGC
ncbi:hypothetical protein KIPB_001732 [Kipferlia bialata]|uniref:adenylate cyclase n=1 Tax=Kipferlia bialata TaxID=797122 RepID=A0A9K3GFC4_9EUKA|nr:hypothetical protein KIPB_001732 [Kipferlia bialata]|eukprot:g1732.t1